MADQDAELQALVAEMVAQKADPAVINSVISQWDATHTRDARPGGGVHQGAPLPLGPPNRRTATTEQFRDPNAHEGYLDYAGQLLGSAAGAVYDVGKNIITGVGNKDIRLAPQPSRIVPGLLAAGQSVAWDTPKAVLGAINTDDPREAGQRIIDAAGYLPFGGRVLKDPVGAVRAVPSDVATLGRGVKAVATHPNTIPAIVALTGAAEGYARGGVPGAIRGGLEGGTVAKGIQLLKKIADRPDAAAAKAAPVAEAAAEAAGPTLSKTKVVKPPKGARLTDPGFETALEDEVFGRVEDLPTGEPPPSDLPPEGLSPDAMKDRIEEALAHTDAGIERQYLNRQQREADAANAAIPDPELGTPAPEPPPPGFMDQMASRATPAPRRRWVSDPLVSDTDALMAQLSENLAAKTRMAQGMSQAAPQPVTPGPVATGMAEGTLDAAAKGNIARGMAYAGRQRGPVADAAAAASSAPSEPPPAAGAAGPAPAGPTPAPPAPAPPAAAAAPAAATTMEQEVAGRMGGVGPLTGDAAVRASAARAVLAGEGDPYQILDANPAGRKKMPPIKNEKGEVPDVLEAVNRMKEERMKLRKKKETPDIRARLDYLDAEIRRQDNIALTAKKK